MIQRFVPTFLGLLVLALFAFPASLAAEEVLDYAPYQDLLQRHVDRSGMVNYAAIHGSEEDRQRLAAFVEEIAKVSQSTLREASREAQLAFYLNAYNALVIHDVVRRWPVENVIHEDGFFDGTKHRVAGRSLTLNELEHTEIIRPQFQEPRIHFVLVCAARDCPRLRREALRGATLERQLDAATREFIPRSTRLGEDGAVVTSKLFEWFAEDFVAHSGTVAAYLRRYTSGEVARALENEDVQIRFAEYDWQINTPR